MNSPRRLSQSSRWLPLLAAAALLTGIARSPAESPAESPPTPQESTRRGQEKIRAMTTARELSDTQAARISHLLQDQASMVELFLRYGLLSDAELGTKIRDIEEITRTGILDALTREQRAIWWTWDLRLDEASLRKPQPRQRLLPAN